jgi:eukaryotic-like serine/threonine-protein kinase
MRAGGRPALALRMPDRSAALPVQIGEIFAGKYRVERVLDNGGMGVVALATHVRLEHRVAIKFIRDYSANSAETIRRFIQEAKATARIRSEHAVKVLDVAELPSGEPYIVMEYLEGSDLQDVLDARGALPPDEAVGYVLQALEAIAEAHLAGIVHRDLKPSNLFLTHRPDGSPLIKVLDFGLSKMARAGHGGSTATSAVLGTPLYMSPEQLHDSKSVDGRTDIWSMGVVLYLLLANRQPFFGKDLPRILTKVFTEDPEPLSAIAPDVPPGLAAIVSRCLAKEPGARFQTVAELASALQAFARPSTLINIQRIGRMTARSDQTEQSAPARPRPQAEWSARDLLAETTPQTWAETQATPKSRAITVVRKGAAIALGIGVVAVAATVLRPAILRRAVSERMGETQLASSASASDPVREVDAALANAPEPRSGVAVGVAMGDAGAVDAGEAMRPRPKSNAHPSRPRAPSASPARAIPSAVGPVTPTPSSSFSQSRTGE